MPEPFSTEVFEAQNVSRDHVLDLGGTRIPFRSVIEDMVFYDTDGTPEASVCTISYERTDTSGPRPVAFVWNGGPGSATSQLHLECLGPYGIGRDGEEMAFRLEENPQCLLDICDLVFLDPVGVGLSRLLKPEKAGKYYCIDGDARSTAFAMIEWLRRRGRWDAPVHIIAESYGTVRACRVLAELGRSPVSESRMVPGIPVKSVVLIGLATSMEKTDCDETLALLPAMAATNWYHTHGGDMASPEMDRFVLSAWDLAARELSGAYFAGDDLPGERAEELAGKLQTFTGLPAAYWLSHNLHLPSPEDFMKRCVSGYQLDLYDSRRKIPLDEPYNPIGNGNMPLKVINGLLLPRLGLDTPRLYYTGNLNVHAAFSFETEKLDGPLMRTHIGCLRDAMRSNGTKALFASGLFDLCTYAGNTSYVVSHAGFPRGHYLHRMYPGGHGVYSTPEGKSAFLRDVRELFLS